MFIFTHVLKIRIVGRSFLYTCYCKGLDFARILFVSHYIPLALSLAANWLHSRKTNCI